MSAVACRASITGDQSLAEMQAKEAERAAKAAERIEVAKAAHAAKIAKLEAAAAELGFKLVAMSAKEKKEYEAAKTAEGEGATEA